MEKTSPLSITTVFATHTSSAEEIDLFIVAGQSNAQGWQGDAAHYPRDPYGLDKTIRFYWVTPQCSSSNGKWTTLKAQSGRFKDGHFGPEITFARSLKKAGYNPAIFKYSLYSTSIAKNWKLPGQSGMYDNMVTGFNNARKLLAEMGHKVHVRGFVWLQGESDAKKTRMAKAYYKRLKSLIKDLRNNVTGNPNLLVILGVDEQHAWVKKNPQIVQAQKRLAEEDDHTVFTSMIGLEKADLSHLKPKGLVEHGERIFTAYKEMTNGQSGSRGFFPPAPTPPSMWVRTRRFMWRVGRP
jgi:hypothetical protein